MQLFIYDTCILMAKPIVLVQGDSFIKRLQQHLGEESVEVFGRRLSFQGISGATVMRL